MRTEKAIKNVIASLFLQVVVIAYGFIVPKLIITNFGSNVNGLISSITQFLGYIALLESGFGPVVKATLYKPIANNDKKTIEKILKSSECFFKKIAIIFLLYIFLLFFIYPLIISNEFEWIYTVSLILIISISTFSEYFFGMTYKLFLNAKQENYIVSFIQIVTYFISVSTIIIAIKLGAGIHIIKLISGLVFVIRPLFQNYYVKKKYNLNLNTIKGDFVISQKWDGLAQHIASVIHTNTDVTVLTIFSTLLNVSIYSVYYIVVKGIKSLIQSITNGFESTFGDMIAKDELDNLNKKYSVYEVSFNAISTILFSCALVLIVPFVSIYTKKITDANYINNLFGVLIVISEFLWAIRQPSNNLIKAAGHFKETRIGAWVECFTNIIVSIILVKKYGLVGVAIGTITAMVFRTIEFIYHTNKYILKRSMLISVKRILLVVCETILIVFVCKYLPFLNNINYFNWIINAFMTFGVSLSVTLALNYLCFKKEFFELKKTLKKFFSKKIK